MFLFCLFFSNNLDQFVIISSTTHHFTPFCTPHTPPQVEWLVPIMRMQILTICIQWTSLKITTRWRVFMLLRQTSASRGCSQLFILSLRTLVSIQFESTKQLSVPIMHFSLSAILLSLTNDAEMEGPPPEPEKHSWPRYFSHSFFLCIWVLERVVNKERRVTTFKPNPNLKKPTVAMTVRYLLHP